MRTLILLFTAYVTLLPSCQQAQAPYHYESMIYDCYRKEQTARSVNVDAVYRQIETIFITNNILPGRSGEDYLKAIEQVRADNFKMLSSDENRILKTIIPFRLSEGEPTDFGESDY